MPGLINGDAQRQGEMSSQFSSLSGPILVKRKRTLSSLKLSYVEEGFKGVTDLLNCSAKSRETVCTGVALRKRLL